MDFRKLLEAECGQSNPISQLVKHATENRTLQDNYCNPLAPGLQQYDSMQPQSFRMDDLVKQLDQIETRGAFMSPGPSVPAQSRCWPDSMWASQYQENAQVKDEHLWEKLNMLNWENQTINHYSAGFQNVFSPPQNELPMLAHISPISQELTETFVDFESTVTIESLDELEKESEKNCVNLQEIHSEPLTDPNNNSDIAQNKESKIPEFANSREFIHYVYNYIDKHCVHGPKFSNPIGKFEMIQKSILNSKKYSHIENNPMKNMSNVAVKGAEAIKNCNYSQAVLYLDEAVRQNPTSWNWADLVFSLHMNNKREETISSLKELLRLYPDHTYGHEFISSIYKEFNCNYQVCYWIFNWLENSESYNHLVPKDFTMVDKNTTKLDTDLLDTVKSICIKAAQLNPTNPDSDLQLMMATLYSISPDLDKVIDCKLAAIKSSGIKKLSNEVVNTGYLLLRSERTSEALDSFLSILEIDNFQSCEGVALVYMYLKNYREAIRYFKKALNAEESGEESKFQIEENTLEAEFALCLRLYLEYYNKEPHIEYFNLSFSSSNKIVD